MSLQTTHSSWPSNNSTFVGRTASKHNHKYTVQSASLVRRDHDGSPSSTQQKTDSAITYILLQSLTSGSTGFVVGSESNVQKSNARVVSNTQKLAFKQNTKYMLICGHLNTFPNTFRRDGIWYFIYQIPNTFCISNFNIIIMTKHNN